MTAGSCTAPDTGGWCNWQAGREEHPINCIDWNQAKAFCEWIGGRLPTAEEWEWAAKGGEARIYPWGDAAPTAATAQFSPSSGTSAWNVHPAGASKQGLLDLAGNVWERTSSRYDANTYEIRGGSWDNVASNLRASGRNRVPPSRGYNSVGFRCGLSR